jgi:AraC-like DNA-binding protein
VNRSDVKDELVSSLGALLTKVQDCDVKTSTDFGKFFCSIENFDGFGIVRRNFETASDPISIPFSCNESSVQMLFSFDGQSAFNDRFDPFLLSPRSHCLNFYNSFECRNLLDENAHQHDITFRLKKSFYADLITNHLASSEDRLPEMILQQKQFNTINQHIPADAAILGILKNIVDCPFKGEMKVSFIREHIRALLTLQLFHFSPIVTGKEIRTDRKITQRDTDILHDVKKYIDENFLHPSSLESLSKHFGINDFKLKHGFKVLFDTSPMRYLQYKRLEYSLCLLRDTDMTIKKIADEVGYSHAANFTTAFTKTFGNSPLHYRPEKRTVCAIAEA